eukprot:TRINITY_DN14071_c0_g1_i2.p1 TRINITY_DN14071_c0_g1~~TRINITY_DN14071_c0_g1_i2.p1  ORF type:complete len:192 (+),score=43.26 TRINITY_DN14071_c0_g1_i2:138-713(+)
MIRRPPRSTLSSSSAASDVYKRQGACGAAGHVKPRANHPDSDLRPCVITMALSKEPSLLARTLVAERSDISGAEAPVTTDSFLWPAWSSGTVAPFRFDVGSPDDIALGLRSKAINATHHNEPAKKPVKKPTGEGSKVFRSFSKKGQAMGAGEDDEMASLEGSITGMKIDRSSKRPRPKSQGKGSRGKGGGK